MAMTKTMIGCAVVLGSLVITAATACSDDDEGRGPYSCPAVGTKNCEGDTAATQADVTFCTKCKTELEAQAACFGYNRPACGPDGKSVDDPTDKCTAEQAKVLACYTGGSTPGDAGAGD